MGTYVEVTGNLVKRDRTSQGAALLGLQALNGILKNLVLTQCTFAIDSVNLFNLCARFVDTVFWHFATDVDHVDSGHIDNV